MVDQHQQNPKFKTIFAMGICLEIPPMGINELKKVTKGQGGRGASPQTCEGTSQVFAALPPEIFVELGSTGAFLFCAAVAGWGMEHKSPFRMAFGTMQFGGRADASASAAMFDACIGAGIAHFDTACGYNEGASESLLGALAKPHRAELYIATKVGYVGGGGRANMTAQFDGSRRRLGMDAVDLLYLHRYDPSTPLEETLETFADFQSRGLIRHIGLSNFPSWAVMKAQAVAARLGTSIDAIQPMYNLVKRQAEVEILPMAADQGIAVFSYSPLGGGLLTGKYAGGANGGRLAEDKRYNARYSAPAAHETAAGLARLSSEVDVDAATMAVAWVMARGVCPIVSARDAAQLAPSLEALNVVLTPDLLARITSLSTTPPPATDRSEEA